jgi:hypothetical protein
MLAKAWANGTIDPLLTAPDEDTDVVFSYFLGDLGS